MRAAGSLAQAAPFDSAGLEYPDTNEGKALSPLVRRLQGRLVAALRESGLSCDDDATRPRLHAMLFDGTTACVGLSDARTGSPWPMGIPRLRMPRGAPSRSTLKLAEAFVTFLGDAEPDRLRPGMRAVDLGAAPGGRHATLR